jgi:hypothetical protein
LDLAKWLFCSGTEEAEIGRIGVGGQQGQKKLDPHPKKQAANKLSMVARACNPSYCRQEDQGLRSAPRQKDKNAKNRPSGAKSKRAG